MLHRVALVRTEVSEELVASIIRATRIDELGTTLAVISNRRTLRRNTESCIVFVFLRSVLWLLVTANVVPSSLILVALIEEAEVPAKNRFLQELQGLTSQKTPFLIVTALNNSNLT
jgi:hypothetical protein